MKKIRTRTRPKKIKTICCQKHLKPKGLRCKSCPDNQEQKK